MIRSAKCLRGSIRGAGDAPLPCVPRALTSWPAPRERDSSRGVISRPDLNVQRNASRRSRVAHPRPGPTTAPFLATSGRCHAAMATPPPPLRSFVPCCHAMLPRRMPHRPRRLHAIHMPLIFTSPLPAPPPPSRIISLPPPPPHLTSLTPPLCLRNPQLCASFCRSLNSGVRLRSSLQSNLVEMSVGHEAYFGAHIDPLYRNNRHQFYDSHAGRPMLPDVQFRVPMESRRDVDKVKDALDVDGVHGVNCDMVTQTVTVTGNVPYHRLLKKLKHIKRKSKLIGFIPDNQAYNPSYHANPYSSSYHGSSSYGHHPIRRPLSPPHLRSSSYIAHPMEHSYYEDYEDYRPSRYSDF